MSWFLSKSSKGAETAFLILNVYFRWLCWVLFFGADFWKSLPAKPSKGAEAALQRGGSGVSNGTNSHTKRKFVSLLDSIFFDFSEAALQRGGNSVSNGTNSHTTRKVSPLLNLHIFIFLTFRKRHCMTGISDLKKNGQFASRISSWEFSTREFVPGKKKSLVWYT